MWGFFFFLGVFVWYILLWVCRGSVMKYESTILLKKFLYLILKLTLEYVGGPSAAHCFGFFLHLFPFLRNQWSKRKGSAVLNIFKFFKVASCVFVFSLWTFRFETFGDGCSCVYAMCKQQIWKHAYVNSVTENVT